MTVAAAIFAPSGKAVRPVVNGGFRPPLSPALGKPHTIPCMNLQILVALGMPAAMLISGIAAWRMAKKDNTKPETPQWRDDSLDDWRRERDAQIELERAQRPRESRLKTGQEEQTETQKKHQRIGG